MGFSVIFNIIRLLGAIKRNPESRINWILSSIRSVTKEDDLTVVLARLERDKKLIARLYPRQNATNYKNVTKDMHSARKRDLKIYHSSGTHSSGTHSSGTHSSGTQCKKRNCRADWMVIFAASGLIISLLSLILFRNSLSSDMVLVFTSLIGFFASILTDVSLFEFGNNVTRFKTQKKPYDDV